MNHTRRSRRYALIAASTVIAAAAGVLLSTTAANAAPVGCTSDFFIATSSTSITERSPAGAITSVPTGALNVLSIAINPVDGNLYALSGNAALGNHLFRVESDGTSTDLGAIAGLPGGVTYPELAFGPDGTAWTSSGLIYQIDIATMTAVTFTHSGGGISGDIAFVDGQMYGWGNSNRISHVDTTTGIVTVTPVTGLGAVGALWSSDGHLYVGQGTTVDEVVGYGTAVPTLTPVATLPASAGDGASCATASSPFLAAADDDFSSTPIDPATGGTTATVLVNDLASGAAIAPADVTATLTSDGGLTGATLATDGTITVPSGFGAGTYALHYQLCLAASPTVCDLATASILLQTPSAPPAGSGGKNLPTTGVDPTPLWATGFGLIAVGLVSVLLARRQRRRSGGARP